MAAGGTSQRSAAYSRSRARARQGNAGAEPTGTAHRTPCKGLRGKAGPKEAEMKAPAVFAVIILLGLSAYNWWQVRELRDEVSRLQVKVAEQQQSGGIADQTVAQAVRAIAAAKDAIGNMNTDSARSALNRAGDALANAGH